MHSLVSTQYPLWPGSKPDLSSIIRNRRFLNVSRGGDDIIIIGAAGAIFRPVSAPHEFQL